MKQIAAPIAAAWPLAAPAAANDSTAEARAGGLALTSTDAIDMVSEDLFVSADEVRVPTQFEVRRKDWRPDRDLDVLIVVLRSAP